MKLTTNRFEFNQSKIQIEENKIKNKTKKSTKKYEKIFSNKRNLIYI